jgi:exodeoxyribonuclease VII large subunit
MTDTETTTDVPGHNLPEFSVSELSFALKREVEQAFPRVRVRGEISQPSFPRSGHCYFRLKDSDAVLDAVCWKSQLPRLGCKVEDGMEVIATGRITTYPGSSRYQIVVERLELAGQGALLKLLEDRRRKLAAEGLFNEQRKRRLPWLPEVVGVITSPSGAVIRDILHRVAERFPRHVLVWPVAVQGERAAAEVAAAIEGFNRLAPDGPVPRPDVLIVARGGGSIEDLWAFNEEIVVRAAAASTIPLISAVGHETDTTLIDFAADRRAPTPTAAAEIAVPVRTELLAQTAGLGSRALGAAGRLLRERETEVQGLGRGLPDPRRLIEEREQRLDDRGERLLQAVSASIERSRARLAQAGASLRSPHTVIEMKRGEFVAEARAFDGALRRYLATERERDERGCDRVARAVERLGRAIEAVCAQRLTTVDGLGKLLESYSFKGVLARGFALVRDGGGHPVVSATALAPGQAVALQFSDGKAAARIEGAPRAPDGPPRPARRARDDGSQGSLL